MATGSNGDATGSGERGSPKEFKLMTFEEVQKEMAGAMDLLKDNNFVRGMQKMFAYIPFQPTEVAKRMYAKRGDKSVFENDIKFLASVIVNHGYAASKAVNAMKEPDKERLKSLIDLYGIKDVASGPEKSETITFSTIAKTFSWIVCDVMHRCVKPEIPWQAIDKYMVPLQYPRCMAHACFACMIPDDDYTIFDKIFQAHIFYRAMSAFIRKVGQSTSKRQALDEAIRYGNQTAPLAWKPKEERTQKMIEWGLLKADRTPTEVVERAIEECIKWSEMDREAFMRLF